MQERHNSIANSLELRLSCTKPSGSDFTWADGIVQYSHFLLRYSQKSPHSSPKRVSPGCILWVPNLIFAKPQSIQSCWTITFQKLMLHGHQPPWNKVNLILSYCMQYHIILVLLYIMTSYNLTVFKLPRKTTSMCFKVNIHVTFALTPVLSCPCPNKQWNQCHHKQQWCCYRKPGELQLNSTAYNNTRMAWKLIGTRARLTVYWLCIYSCFFFFLGGGDWEKQICIWIYIIPSKGMAQVVEILYMEDRNIPCKVATHNDQGPDSIWRCYLTSIEIPMWR